MVPGYYKARYGGVTTTTFDQTHSVNTPIDDGCPMCGRSCSCNRFQVVLVRDEPPPAIDLRKRINDDRTWLRWKQAPRSPRS